MVNRWVHLLYAFVGVGLLYPLLYLFNLEKIAGGILFEIPTYLFYLLLIGFFLYPFVKGIQCLKVGQKVPGIFLLLAGILVPVLSGAFGILLIESMGKGGSLGKKKAS
ncbi:hypothetical protein MO867_15990 [Microbulbifer sp. OS29]|uniref:Uncharacterized protein n=1 Tax=Microbulbifer okhotskensis TaxID=2926617 RepID=A0A9X2J8R3_9GAMM|nr:hypothetical protein [Microbulbifer okhotskensis]MCO1335836.1 hypothetical protein [Microbulbifer okhotskensis]